MIRTYTRKPPECRYIEGVLGLCRLCLQKAEEAVPIFTEDRADICSSLALRIMICVGLELKREDTLPNHICQGCYKDLEQYYTFRKKCEVSYQKLKYHIQAIQNKKIADALTSATEEAIKQIDGGKQEENVNVHELELMMGSEESYGILEIDAAPVINDVPSDIPAETKETNTEDTTDDIKKTTNGTALSPQESLADPLELPGMIAAVLVRLGLLARAGPLLAARGPQPARIQLETADDAVVRMEVVEEDDDDDGTAEKEQDGLKTEAEFCLVQENPSDVQKTSADGHGGTEVIDEVKTKQTTRRRACGAGGGGGGGGVECSWCGRVLGSQSALRRHARTHSGERPYACARCPRRFAQREVMRRHMLVHDEVRPHQCAQCPKSFTQRGALALHARSHLPPAERALPLHACPRCPKLFLHSSGLSRHLMAHAGRVYECGACRKQFADRSSVLRHVRRANHPPAPPPPPADSPTQPPQS